MTSISKITKILVTDNHPVFRKAFITLLSQNKNIRVIGEVTNGQQALDFPSKNTVAIKSGMDYFE